MNVSMLVCGCGVAFLDPTRESSGPPSPKTPNRPRRPSPSLRPGAPKMWKSSKKVQQEPAMSRFKLFFCLTVRRHAVSWLLMCDVWRMFVDGLPDVQPLTKLPLHETLGRPKFWDSRLFVRVCDHVSLQTLLQWTQSARHADGTDLTCSKRQLRSGPNVPRTPACMRGQWDRKRVYCGKFSSYISNSKHLRV